MLFSNLTAVETFLVFGVVFWPLFLLVAVLMAGLALTALFKGRPWLAGLCAIVAVVILFPVLLSGSLAWQDMREQQQRDAVRAAHRWSLQSTQTVAGIVFPAGSVLQLQGSYDMGRKHQAQLEDIDHVELAAPTHAFGARIKGLLSQRGGYWRATLAGAQIVAGVPCTGDIKIRPSGQLLQCTLSRQHRLLGYAMPPGTTFDLSSYLWEMRLPDGSMLAFDSDSQQLAFCVGDYNLPHNAKQADVTRAGAGGDLKKIGILAQCRTADE